jgi:ERCC4-related helicase
MNWRMSGRVSLGNTKRIPPKDALRQMRTASEILRRFDTQPGCVLADEVGMGKTYVALAVAVSVIESTRGRKPVVIMVPPAVQEKWPREWDVFREKCLSAGREIRATAVSVNRGSDFLKLLDDLQHRRNHIIFLTHGALTSSLVDPWIRLALVRQALLYKRDLQGQKRVLPRWAGRLFYFGPFRDPGLVAKLLTTHPLDWASLYARHTGNELDDDPVPEALLASLPEIDLSQLTMSLRNLPLRESVYLEARLKNVRRAVASAMPGVWRECLAKMSLHLPLLIMDEAHHLKNPWTRLAGLFDNKDAMEDVEAMRGPLGRVFDRMLFLTATPFQLGHHELLEVLRRFEGIRWGTVADRRAYQQTLEELRAALDAAQSGALRLDVAWSRLAPGDLADLDPSWWSRADPQLPDRVRAVTQHISDVHSRMRRAEELLRPWVIRHIRGDRDRRRSTFAGRSILDGETDGRGLEIESGAVLPFLLAARAQAIVAMEGLYTASPRRFHLAEGLASSFEAYRETRAARSAGSTVDEDAAPVTDASVSEEVGWYLRQIDNALPSDDPTTWGHHPKIAAVAQRTLELWKRGEKVVVFCFYIATGKALRDHISRAMRNEVVRLGREMLGSPEAAADRVIDELQSLADRFFDPDAPLTKAAGAEIGTLLKEFKLAPEERGALAEIAIRFLRTPSFLARYLDLRSDDPVSALENALASGDQSGLGLRDKIRSLGQFVVERVQGEREELLEALQAVQTGSISAQAAYFDASERSARREVLLPNVRLVNGGVARDTRRRLMLAFNTPFFPEVLVASSVMAEGVDLHTNCRFVIHHDLDWNPSVIEQRTGRVDRLGSKAERSSKRIVTYEPFVGGTQDEKQYRVVKDRERWFNVVMGERMSLDEAATDRLARRVPLPRDLAESLALHLALPHGVRQ